jgi:hypothetical protein
VSPPLPRDIEEGDAAHRAIYLRGYQDGYRSAHEAHATGRVPDVKPEPEVLRRLEAVEAGLRAIQNDAADRATVVVDLSRRIDEIVDELEGHTERV